jgi:hypothetical protein
LESKEYVVSKNAIRGQIDQPLRIALHPSSYCSVTSVLRAL